MLGFPRSSLLAAARPSLAFPLPLFTPSLLVYWRLDCLSPVFLIGVDDLSLRFLLTCEVAVA